VWKKTLFNNFKDIEFASFAGLINILAGVLSGPLKD